MYVADYVQCGYCEEVMYLVRGSDVCPKCRRKGGLAWADPENEDNYEVEVGEDEVANMDDYDNVVNDTEEFVN